MKISFSLRLLFAFIAVATLLAGVLIRYYEVEQRFANANAHFKELKAEHDTGPRIYTQENPGFSRVLRQTSGHLLFYFVGASKTMFPAHTCAGENNGF
jgi:hypothetical protein